MSTQKSTPILTSTGRLLWGSLYEPKTEDFEGNPLVIKSGPDAGKPTQYFEFGLAFEKQPSDNGHWGNTALGNVIWNAGHAAHPHAAPHPDFSWKVTDGDSKKPGKPYKGKPGRAPCEKEGYPGHWVFSFRSSFAPKVVNADGSAYILEPGAVVPGDWVQVSGTVQGNTGATPGVYLNHNIVALQYKGIPIVTGVDPKTVGFGQGPRPAGYVAPTGSMSAPPVAGALPPGGQPAVNAGAPNVPAVPGVPGSVPVTSPTVPGVTSPSNVPAPGVPQVAVTPQPGFLHPATGVPTAPVPLAPVVAVGPVMTAKAGGATWAQFQAQGWTVEAARAQGYVA